MAGLFALLRGHPKVAVAALTLSAAGTGALLRDEGSVNKVYLDVGGIPTVCVGHTATVKHTAVGTAFSDADCKALLKSDTAHAQAGVKAAVRVPVTQQQYDALVSFTFNVGNSALGTSTLVRKLNAGDCKGAAAEFPRWVLVQGKYSQGLANRRARERAAFEEHC